MTAMGDKEEKRRIAARIVSVFDAAVSGKHGEHVASMMEEYAAVGIEEACRIHETTGLDVRGFSHSISGSEVLHAWNKHGPEGVDGSRHIIKEDFANLHEIITTADEVIDGGKTNAGLPGIMYKKTYQWLRCGC